MSVLFVTTASAASGQTPTESALVSAACRESPDARIARAHAALGSVAVLEASVLPNPTIVAEHQRTLSGPDEEETVVGIEVPLGTGGARFLLQDAAQSKRRQFAFEADASLLETAIAFRSAYADAATAEARLDVLSQQQELLDRLSETIAALAQSGEASDYDVLRQRTQARLHRQRVEETRADLLRARSELEVWLGEGLVPERISVNSLPALLPDAAARSDEHPEFRATAAEIQAAEFEVAAARRRWVPDLDVFAGYRGLTVDDQTSHGISLQLSVPITFFDHGQADLARALATRQQAQAREESSSRRREIGLRASRITMHMLAHRMNETASMLEDALLLQSRVFQLYAAGESSLTEVFDALQTVEDTRLVATDLAHRFQRARLELMLHSGTQFDADLDRACGTSEGNSRND